MSEETIQQIVYVNQFNEASTKTFYENFNKILNKNPQIIPVLIDSYGGYIDSLAAMIDIIQSVDIPVATICVGKAMSCGAMLLSCGTPGYRYIAPTARVMIHHMLHISGGKVPEIEINTAEVKRLQKTVFSIVDKNIGQTKGFLLNKLKERGNTDWYLDAKQALNLGLVDHVRLPTIKRKTKTYTKVVLK